MITIPLRQSHNASVALYQNDLYRQLDTAIEELQTAEEAWRQLAITDILEKNLEKLNRTYELVTANEELDETTKMLAIANIKSVNEDLNLELEFSDDVIVSQEGILDAIGSVFRALIEFITKIIDFIVNLITKTIEWLGNLFGGKKSSGGGTSSGSSSTKESVDKTIKELDEIEKILKKETLHTLYRNENKDIVKEVGKIFRYLDSLEYNIIYMELAKEIVREEVLKDIKSAINEFIKKVTENIEGELNTRKKNFEEVCGLAKSGEIDSTKLSKVNENIYKSIEDLVDNSLASILTAGILKEEYVEKLFKNPKVLEDMKHTRYGEKGYFTLGVEFEYGAKKDKFLTNTIIKLKAENAYKFTIKIMKHNDEVTGIDTKLERLETVPVEITKGDNTLTKMIREKIHAFDPDHADLTLSDLKNIMLELRNEWIKYFNIATADIEKLNKDITKISKRLNSLKDDIKKIKGDIEKCNIDKMDIKSELSSTVKATLNIVKIDLITVINIIKNLRTFMRIVKYTYYDPFTYIKKIEESGYKIRQHLMEKLKHTK